MFTTVVWATDGSDAADRALPFAKELAAAPGARLLAVHVPELLAGRFVDYPMYVDDEELEAKIIGQVHDAREEGLDATYTFLRTGHAGSAQLIVEAAREVGADVIVVGTRGHGPLAGLLVGSVTQRLLHLAPCPVLAVPVGKGAAHGEPVAVTTASAKEESL
jgi:nucleotide-binding universal stress UspA family protein